ncbi:MAG: hypothetical protein ACREYE_09120, partial [Gammaproteobacteria bacterium]
DIIKKIERARVKMEQIKPRSTLPRGKKEGGLTVKLFKGHYTSRNADRSSMHEILLSEPEIRTFLLDLLILVVSRRKDSAA